MNLATVLALTAAALAAVLPFALSPAAAQPAPAPQPLPETLTVAAAANAFAGDLYAQLKTQKGNLFFSPYSISSALTMTSRGAKGPTADEMIKVLHLPPDAAAADTGYRSLVADLQADRAKKGYQLAVANALWGQQGEPFLPAFTDLLQKDYGANLQPLNFIAAPDESRKTINAWVEKQTRDRIKDLLPADAITTQTRLVLTNAIYFKGDWQDKFQKTATRDGDFAVALDQKVTVPMMRQQARFAYAETRDWQVLEMPYQGRELAMLVILPKHTEWDSIDEKRPADEPVMAGVGAVPFSAEFVKNLRAQLRPQDVNVTLPRWTATQQFDLNHTLPQMGMKMAFTSGADFSGINGRKEFFISDVIHKAFVEVNEEGTEAAGATAVVMRGLAMREPPPPPKVFTADHPFLYLIVHQPTGAILFLGRLNNPKP